MAGAGAVTVAVAAEILTVPTCIGCGAMNRFGTCEAGCSERRLDLVPAAALESLELLGVAAQASAERLLAVTRQLAGPEPADPEAAWRSLREAARGALRAPAVADRMQLGEPEAPEAAITWWCPDCGGLQAPQPCLGICVWRPARWVDREFYDRTHARIEPALEGERRLRALVRRIASVTPHDGRWRQTWRAFTRAAVDVSASSAPAAR